MFELAAGYAKRGMSAYSELQTAEFASEGAGYTATKHQREVRGRRGVGGGGSAASTCPHTLLLSSPLLRS
jgi:isocitrate lyase